HATGKIDARDRKADLATAIDAGPPIRRDRLLKLGSAQVGTEIGGNGGLCERQHGKPNHKDDTPATTLMCASSCDPKELTLTDGDCWTTGRERKAQRLLIS